MLDTADRGRPERRSALIAHKPRRLNIDIAALSEVRLPDEGSLQELGAGYTLYWSGRPASERKLSGVGFMIKTSIASKMENLPTGHSDCFISMRLPLRRQQHVPSLSVYSPTLLAEPAEKDKFYTDLRNLLQKTPADDKVIILGDFNARVGRDSEAWQGVLGKHGVGSCNDSGCLLLEFCAEQQLSITNTIFQQKDSRKTTWMHPRSKHWHLTDYVLVHQKDHSDVLHTRVMPSAECHNDHRLVRCKLRLHFKPKPKKYAGPPKKKLDIPSLQCDAVKANFQADLQCRLEDIIDPTDSSPETLWDQLKTAIGKSSIAVLGFASKRNKDWFDENNEEIQALLSRKRVAHQAHLAQPSCPVKKSAFRLICSMLQCKLREIQNEWWNRFAQRTQLCADNGDYKGFYKALKAGYGPRHMVQSPMRSANGKKLHTDNTLILNRWSEHFQELFSAERTVQEAAILQIPHLPVKVKLDEPPTIAESLKAIQQLKSGKAAGTDRIPPET
ncbi:craniofacial development 2 [Labeo rohita]|uniref:Craniofacial development 2 n=1 Tax=Labeo rohita TaxID=84645 RepID=A0A498N642_LABRO|nr:craniofacial development 2 [Labeo rohita]RXN36294.1 craniofacial development 2 [Labeo rohita]